MNCSESIPPIFSSSSKSRFAASIDSAIVEMSSSTSNIFDAARVEHLLLSYTTARAALEAELANLESGAGPQSLLGKVRLALGHSSGTSDALCIIKRDGIHTDRVIIKQEQDIANHLADCPSGTSLKSLLSVVKAEEHDNTLSDTDELDSMEDMPSVKYFVGKTTHLRVRPMLWHPRSAAFPRGIHCFRSPPPSPAVLVERRPSKRSLGVCEDVKPLAASTSSSMTKIHPTDDALRPVKVRRLSPSAHSALPEDDFEPQWICTVRMAVPRAPRRSARLRGEPPSLA